MEDLALLGVIGAGKYLKDTLGKKDINTNINEYNNVPENQKPNGKNIYENKRSYEIWEDEQSRSNRLWKLAKNPLVNNVGFAGPPFPRFNKVDGNENLPLEFDDYQTVSKANNADQGTIVRQGPKINNDSAHILDNVNSGGWNGISLTGQAIMPDKFVHNNMVPFFGGNVTQSVDEYSTRQIFETFTGEQDNYIHKQEQGLLFAPQQNMSNVYGTQNLDGYQLDRYYVSAMRNNEAPIQRVNVGPGLNAGYTAEPDGGFQQPKTQEYVMPKNVDEIRVKTNPKMTYYGRIVSGNHIGQRGVIGSVYKNRPDTYYEQTPDMYFTNTGQVIAPMSRACEVLKFTNRKLTENKKRLGPAAPTRGTTKQIRSTVQKSRKNNYDNPTPMQKNAQGRWSITNSDEGANPNAPNDYGKRGITIATNSRTINGSKTRLNNANVTTRSIRVKASDKARTTMKETYENNTKWGNQIQISDKKGKIYDPNDIARTTIKETTENNNYNGQLTGISKNKLYDPNDVAKITLRQTLEKNTYNGNVKGNVLRGTVPYTDKAKRTIRQNIKKVYMAPANANDAKKSGYIVSKVVMPTTIKDTTLASYNGNVYGITKDGGYNVTDVNANNTNRQFTSNVSYEGIAGPATNHAQTSRKDLNNMVVKSNREQTQVAHTAGKQGVNEIITTSSIGTTTTKKLTEARNEYLRERGVQPSAMYNSLPTPSVSMVTKQKDELSNQINADRLDPALLEPFKENPYTQPLNSWF